jgi:predicted alpha/beta superfamily hydrolase
MQGRAAGQHYPVLYLLDAEEHFYSTAAMAIQMSGRWPEVIVVGITNTNRDRDLKPTLFDKAGVADKNSGGGSKFMSFIEKELIPHIDSMYPTAPYRIFSGHSLGGLTVVNTFLTNTQLFNAYIAIDPSLWWNREILVEKAEQTLKIKKFNNRSLFVGRANNMPGEMDTLAALKDTTQYTMLYRSVTHFLKVLRNSAPVCLRWTSKYYPEEIHGTVQLNGEYDALKFLFSFYQFRTSSFELNPDLNIDSALTAHFLNASNILGYPVKPSKNLVNNLGYTCMSLKKWDKAEIFFKLNIENYPDDPNGYDSMGDYYEAIGDIKKAIENFTKALTLGNDQGTKQKLENLKSWKQ